VFESSVRTKTKLTHLINDVSFTLARGRQTAGPVSLSCIGLKSQIFFIHSHLASSLEVTFFEFMEKIDGSLHYSLPGSQWWRFGDLSLHRFWL